MSQTIIAFERRCTAAGVRPVDALKRAGLHEATWFRWKADKVSPTLRSFEAAEAALGQLIADNDNEPRDVA